MSKFSDYLESNLLNAVLRNVSYTSPANVYIALYTSDPTDANTGTEVSSASYARQSITFSAPVSGSCSNDSAVTFPTPTENWGTVSHMGLFDAPTGGNLLFYGSLASPIEVALGMRIRFPTSSLIVSLD
jgi:hypothetical protein